LNNTNDGGAPDPSGGWSANSRSPVQREEPVYDTREICGRVDSLIPRGRISG
jgi:hypothetical protein